MRYLGRRLALAIPTLVLVLVASFLMIRVAPGDPAEAFADEVRMSDERLTAIRRGLGLDRPIPVQFAYYVGHVMRGDLGRSYFTREPVLGMILTRLRFTVELATAAVAVSVTAGVLLGVLAAIQRGTWLDTVTSTAAVGVYSMPRFWAGLLLVLFFAVRFPWFPVIGAGTTGSLLSRLHHLVLPTLAMALAQAAMLSRVTRGSVLDILDQEFIRTARGKGLTERRVLFRHALRNALLPILTVIGLGFGRLLGGSVVVETVFVRPGLGTLLVEAIRARDYPVVQGTILIFAIGIIAVNIVVDTLYPLIDPRIRP